MQHSGLKLDREPGFDIIGAAPTRRLRAEAPAQRSNQKKADTTSPLHLAL